MKKKKKKQDCRIKSVDNIRMVFLETTRKLIKWAKHPRLLKAPSCLSCPAMTQNTDHQEKTLCHIFISFRVFKSVWDATLKLVFHATRSS